MDDSYLNTRSYRVWNSSRRLQVTSNGPKWQCQLFHKSKNCLPSGTNANTGLMNYANDSKCQIILLLLQLTFRVTLKSVSPPPPSYSTATPPSPPPSDANESPKIISQIFLNLLHTFSMGETFYMPKEKRTHWASLLRHWKKWRYDNSSNWHFTQLAIRPLPIRADNLSI